MFNPHFQNYDSDTHQHIGWRDIARPGDGYGLAYQTPFMKRRQKALQDLDK